MSRSTKNAKATTNGVHSINGRSGRFASTEKGEVHLGHGLTAQVAHVTPEVAEQWAAQVHPNQRSVKSGNLMRIKAEITDGRWKLNGEPIIFDSNGMLADGQHRLRAVVETGIPIEVLVVRGVEPDTYSTLDGGLGRRTSDALRAMGVKHPILTSSAVQLYKRYHEGKIFDCGYTLLSPEACCEFVREHPEVIDAAQFADSVRHYLKCQFPSVKAFGILLFGYIDKSAADKFFESLKTGADLPSGSPILPLRTRLLARSMSKNETIVVMFKAWNLWRAGKSAYSLKWHAGERLASPI